MSTIESTRSLISARTGFLAVFLGGFALCTRGIGQAPIHGWLHPASIAGYILGGLALLLAAAVVFHRRVPPITSDRRALIALLALIVLKIAVAGLYQVI